MILNHQKNASSLGFFRPILLPALGFERDNERFCSLCNLAKFRAAPSAERAADPRSAAPSPVFAPPVASAPRAPLPRSAATPPTDSALEPRLLDFSRVFILAQQPLCSADCATLAAALAAAGVALDACSFSYPTACCAHSLAEQRALCAGFILSRIADCGASSVLVLGQNAASGLLERPKHGQILRAQVFNKAVKFVINYHPKSARQDASIHAAFVDMMGFLRT